MLNPSPCRSSASNPTDAFDPAWHQRMDLPKNDLSDLKKAFDLIGRNMFAEHWPHNMAEVIRLGQRSKSPDLWPMGQWVLKVLVQCVQNGWLPLVYFQNGKRIWYFESSGEPNLHHLYPKPTDDGMGQIELEDGEIYDCMVDLRGFKKVLRAKFGEPTKGKPGRRREYLRLDAVLTDYFVENGPTPEAKDAIQHVAHQLPRHELPRSLSTLYDRIRQARDAVMRNSGNALLN